MSCNASGLCVAVAADGSVHATGNAASATPTWSATLIDAAGAPLSAVSCTDTGLCVMVDHAGNALESDNPTAGPPVWASTPIDTAPHPLTAVSCLSAGFCAATDSVGDTLAGTLPAPVVATGIGTASTQTAATLGASVNPNDATLADCHFDYGPTTAYGSSVACSVVPSAIGGSQSVAASLAGLSAATTYHFRIVASSGVATADGADATFTTPAPLKASPSLSGTPAVGSTLTCKPNVTTTASETVAYAWLRDTVAIAGRTGATYLVAAADETHHLSCQVTIAGDGGSATATSGFDAIPSQSVGKIARELRRHREARRDGGQRAGDLLAAGGRQLHVHAAADQRRRPSRHKSQTVTVGSTRRRSRPGVDPHAVGLAERHRAASLLSERHTLAVTLTVKRDGARHAQGDAADRQADASAPRRSTKSKRSSTQACDASPSLAPLALAGRAGRCSPAGRRARAARAGRARRHALHGLGHRTSRCAGGFPETTILQEADRLKTQRPREPTATG